MSISGDMEKWVSQAGKYKKVGYDGLDAWNEHAEVTYAIKNY